MPVSKLLRRGYSTVVAVVCAASIAYAIHVNGETGRAELAAARAHQWEIYARATLAHRRHTAKSLELLVRRYNKLAQSATAKQRRLLATLAVARRDSEKARPKGTAAVVFKTTETIAISPEAKSPTPVPSAPAASAAPAPPSTPTTKTS